MKTRSDVDNRLAVESQSPNGGSETRDAGANGLSDLQDRDSNSVESVGRDEDVTRVLTTNVGQRVEAAEEFKVPVLTVEPFAAGPVDSARDVSRTRQANGDPLWVADRGRDRHGGMRPACALGLDDLPGLVRRLR